MVNSRDQNLLIQSLTQNIYKEMQQFCIIIKFIIIA